MNKSITKWRSLARGYPYLYHHRDYQHSGDDGVFEPYMTICVESIIGDDSGGEGVKLEQHCLVPDSGLQALCQFPFEPCPLSDG